MNVFNKILGVAGGTIIGLMMLLIVAEVSSRLFLGRSIEGIVELVGIFLALAVFFGFSPCEESGNHVRVDLVQMRLPNSIAHVQNVMVYFLAIAIVSVTTWQVGLDALNSWKMKEVLPGATVRVPVYPAKAAAFIGYLSFCIQLIISLVSKLRRINRNDSTRGSADKYRDF